MYANLLAARSDLPKEPIDEIFSQLPQLNQKRARDGLAPVINLSLGEPHIAINTAVIADLLPDIDFTYLPLQGTSSTLEAVTRLYQHYYPASRFSEEELMVCNGATQALWNAFNILLDTGDKVLAFEPYYTGYVSHVQQLGGCIIKIPTLDNGFRPCASTLQEALHAHPDAKVLVLNYPNNPSGIDLTRQEAEELAAVLIRYPDIAIIMDEVYREFSASEHITILDCEPALKDRCIVINSASKGLIGAPGLRAGMAGANREWIERMTTIQSLMVNCVSCLTQKVLISAINQKLQAAPAYQSWLEQSRNEYFSNVKTIAQALQSMGFDVVPGGNGFYILASAKFLIGASGFAHDKAIVSHFLHTAGVAFIPGSAFGIDERQGYMRISCARPQAELEQAMRNIHLSLKEFTYAK